MAAAVPEAEPDEPPAMTSGKQTELLISLYQHRLMSTDQLHRLHGEERTLRSTQIHLAQLRTQGLAAAIRLRPRTPALWYATADGAEIAELAQVRRRPYRMRPGVAVGQIAAHTLAVNEVGCLLAEAARTRGDEFGPLDWDHEIAHPYRATTSRRTGTDHLVIADAVLSYTANNPDSTQTSMVRFLELDRGTCTIEALIRKIRHYSQMHDYPNARAPAWRSQYTVFPRLLIVLDGLPPDRLARRGRTLIDLATEEPDILHRGTKLGVLITTLNDLAHQGPRTAIFHPLVPDPVTGHACQTFHGQAES